MTFLKSIRRFVGMTTALCVVLAAAPAYAQCVEPEGRAGVMIFNGAHKVLQYCNGDDWIGLWGPGGSGGDDDVPAGIVLAFNRTVCPNGWAEYTPARGRFIRGIDNGAGNDPSGTRAPGSVQADDFKSHTHTPNNFLGISTYQMHDGTVDGSRFATGYDKTEVGAVFNSTGGAETRPKNVSLLYCEKQ